jgi:transcriptional regulator with GAF, ATPase, and Fis domain
MSGQPTTDRKSHRAGSVREPIDAGPEPAELRADGPEACEAVEVRAPSDPTPATPALPQYRVARAAALLSFERSYLRRLIETTGGNASAAARAANMDRPYLLSLLRRHGLR